MLFLTLLIAAREKEPPHEHPLRHHRPQLRRQIHLRERRRRRTRHPLPSPRLRIPPCLGRRFHSNSSQRRHASPSSRLFPSRRRFPFRFLHHSSRHQQNSREHRSRGRLR